jgi:hypothetical protein
MILIKSLQETFDIEKSRKYFIKQSFIGFIKENKENFSLSKLRETVH